MAQFTVDVDSLGLLASWDRYENYTFRLGARALRDAIEKHLRGAMVRATLSKSDVRSAELVVTGDDLLLQPRESHLPAQRTTR